MEEADDVVLDHESECFLCGEPIRPGVATRIRWTPVGLKRQVALLGLFHHAICGPTMLDALRQQTPC